LIVTLDNPAGVSANLSYISSVVIILGEDTRFFRGVELTIIVPQNYLSYRGSIAAVMYTDLDNVPHTGISDLEGRQLFIDPIMKLQTVYQIPMRINHGLRTTPYVTVPTRTVIPSSFPVLFRIMPVVKGLTEEIERIRFNLNVKPILSNEGALSLSFKYPEPLQGKPFSLLIDDVLIENWQEQRLLKDGEHHLMILSDDFRNENRLFLIERGKTLSLNVELQDPTPLLIFEAPENARIYFNNVLISNISKPFPVDPGQHEIKFQLSDYSIIRPIMVQKGKTYKIAMMVDINVSESE
jgi:hypothetical protein